MKTFTIYVYTKRNYIITLFQVRACQTSYILDLKSRDLDSCEARALFGDCIDSSLRLCPDVALESISTSTRVADALYHKYNACDNFITMSDD